MNDAQRKPRCDIRFLSPYPHCFGEVAVEVSGEYGDADESVALVFATN